MLDPEDQRLALMAICSYALDGEEMQLSGVPAAVFMLTKPNLDTSKKRADSGRIGGKSKADTNQKASKDEAKLKQNPSKDEAIKDKGYRIKDKGQEIKDKDDIPGHKLKFAENVSMTQEQHAKLLVEYGEADTARLVTILDNYKGSSGKRYKDDYKAILSWCVDRLNEEKANSRKPAKINAPPSMHYDGETVKKDMDRLDRIMGANHGS